MEKAWSRFLSAVGDTMDWIADCLEAFNRDFRTELPEPILTLNYLNRIVAYFKWVDPQEEFFHFMEYTDYLDHARERKFYIFMVTPTLMPLLNHLKVKVEPFPTFSDFEETYYKMPLDEYDRTYLDKTTEDYFLNRILPPLVDHLQQDETLTYQNALIRFEIPMMTLVNNIAEYKKPEDFPPELKQRAVELLRLFVEYVGAVKVSQDELQQRIAQAELESRKNMLDEELRIVRETILITQKKD